MAVHRAKVLLGYLVWHMSTDSDAISLTVKHNYVQKTMAAILENRLCEQAIANFATQKGTENNYVMKWKMIDRCHSFMHTCM